MLTKKAGKILLTIMLGATILLAGWGLYNKFIHNDRQGFTDLPSDHWAYETIMWAVDRGIITGYSDGTIHPNKPVTEAELLAMLFRTFEEDDQEEKLDWAVTYYRQAMEKEWEVWGQPSRNQVMNRVDFARIVTNALGYNLSTDGAIQTMLNLELVEGQKKATVDGYGHGELTRGEALKVMKQLEEMGVNELKSRPATPSPEPEIQSDFLTTMKPIIELNEDLGYDLRTIAWSRELGLSQNGEGIIFLTYRDAQSPYNQLVVYAADQQEHRATAEKMIQALGIKNDGDFASSMEQAMRERKSVYKEYGQWEFLYSLGSVENYVQINFRKK